eukprot:6550706-Lingulodinium_polyedra.AAC.1
MQRLRLPAAEPGTATAAHDTWPCATTGGRSEANACGALHTSAHDDNYVERAHVQNKHPQTVSAENTLVATKCTRAKYCQIGTNHVLCNTHYWHVQRAIMPL